MKSSTILFGGLGSLAIGLVLILYYQSTLGLFFILFLTPCLFLYPVIRFLFFGGKDSVAAAVITVITEEVIKAGIKNKIENRQRKKT